MRNNDRLCDLCSLYTYFILVLCALYSMMVLMGSDITLVIVSLCDEMHVGVCVHAYMVVLVHI